MVVELIGTGGASLLLLAYFLVSSRRLPLDSVWVHLLNLAGAVLLGINAAAHHAIPPATLNVLWSLIALAALVRHAMRSRVR